MAAAARGRGHRALCRSDMEGVIAGYHMITSWNQAFFQGIQQEQDSSRHRQVPMYSCIVLAMGLSAGALQVFEPLVT